MIKQPKQNNGIYLFIPSLIKREKKPNHGPEAYISNKAGFEKTFYEKD